jgi:hypothetical protein
MDQERGANYKWVLGLVNQGLRCHVPFNYVWGLEVSNKVSS